MNEQHAAANVRPFADIGLGDLEQVGGKNSSLGEMVGNLSELGVNVPDGFATTADAYRRFIGDTGLAEEISGKLKGAPGVTPYLPLDRLPRARPAEEPQQ